MLGLAFQCAVVAYVYCAILVKPGMILHWWAVLVEKALVKETLTPVYERKEHWLYKPVIGCEQCVSGQIAFWISLFQYDLFQQVFIICMSILITKTISVCIGYLTAR